MKPFTIAGRKRRGLRDRATEISKRTGALPVIGSAIAVQKRYAKDNAGYLASAMTYSAFLSVFPLLLLAMSIIGFVLRDPVARARWVASLSNAVPGLGSIIGQNFATLVNDRAAIGIVGIVSLAWTGRGVVQAAGFALDRIFGRKDLGGIRSYLWSFGTLGALGSLMLASIAAGSVVDALLPGVAGGIAGTAVTLLLDFCMFLIAYRLLIQRPGPPFATLWRGAIFSAVGWTVLKVIGVWYAARTVAGAQAVYGVFAATIGVLVMLSLASRIFLYGAELNAVTTREPAREQRVLRRAG